MYKLQCPILQNTKNTKKVYSRDVCVCVCVCVCAGVCAFMLYALNFDKYVFVENV